MNGKHRKVLAAVLAEPASATIEWVAIAALLKAAGCQVVEGSGSRVRFICSGQIESFHRPHPDKEAKRYQVRAARDFLLGLGVLP